MPILPISLVSLAAPLSLIALLATAPAPPVPADTQGFLFERAVDVPAPGWVRVPLDLAAVRHLAPEGADLHVFSPGGGEVPARVEPRIPRIERRPVKISELEEVENGEENRAGWMLLIDVGAEPVPHERLFLQITRATALPSVHLEGSRDRTAWQTLAVSDLFRVGSGEGLQKSALSYPSTDHRWLRLFWPRAAGFPRISAVEVETVSGPTLAFATRGASCRETGPESPPATACELLLPGMGQVLRRLTLDVEGEGAVGYRLYAPVEGRWQRVTEGVWRRTEEKTRHVLLGAAEPVAGTSLRLELYGSGGTVPLLTGYGVDLAVPTVLFQAEEAGRYTLAYGGGNVRERSGGGDLPESEEAAWLEAEPERELPASPLPAGSPGAPLGRGRFRGVWPVLSASARPGDLIRLELPDLVYGVARADLGDVRLAIGDRQIPFSHWSPPAPALVAESRDLRPRTLRQNQESEAEIKLPLAGLPLTSLFLTTPEGPLRRTVGLRYRAGRPAGREAGPVVRETWDCDPAPPLPCRAELETPGQPREAPERLAVRVHDGDDPPLARLSAEVWRRRDVLLFVWPEVDDEAEVRLLAGARDLRAPDYDFAALGSVLLARPWQPAEVDLDGASAAEDPAWGRWVLPGALGLAAVFLLLLLRRVLTEP